MSNNNLLKPISIAISTAVVSVAATSAVSAADANPFGMNQLSSGYMQVAEGKCGGDKKGKMSKEGKCGEGKMAKEGKCGDMKKGSEGKCGEGKCGSDKMKKDMGKEGKCGGEGKCGQDKK